jgi:hypothetical protein
MRDSAYFLRKPGAVNGGEDLPQHKLTEAQVIDIYRRSHSERGCDLASQYGVNFRTVSAIKNGHNWSHLTRHGIAA